MATCRTTDKPDGDNADRGFQQHTWNYGRQHRCEFSRLLRRRRAIPSAICILDRSGRNTGRQRRLPRDAKRHAGNVTHQHHNCHWASRLDSLCSNRNRHQYSFYNCYSSKRIKRVRPAARSGQLRILDPGQLGGHFSVWLQYRSCTHTRAFRRGINDGRSFRHVAVFAFQWTPEMFLVHCPLGSERR